MEETKMSFRFEEQYKQLLEEIAKLDRRTMTDEIKLLIDKRAVELGLEPVYPLAKKTEV
jgi:ribonucleotide reductase beta subunit family protein with ferritin-like domain